MPDENEVKKSEIIEAKKEEPMKSAPSFWSRMRSGNSAKKEIEVEEISVIRLVAHMIQQGIESGASDIHIDPGEKEIEVRFRIDGVLHLTKKFEKILHSEIITRIKVLAGLRTDEHQAPQDGRIKFIDQEKDGRHIDIRVSIAPTFYGENCVMRLLGDSGYAFSLEGLGFLPGDLKKVERAMKKPYGLILATGPTGSGKTTVLYAILKILNKPEISIITIEDPVEYSMTGIDQIQVNARTGLTFAQGLRFILRQDPNVIMVGEIRDAETAGIAVNAAMTGHLVLSTLHTNDATVTLPRLLDMGVEPFLIASTINIAIGQRLVRKICLFCKVTKKLSEVERTAFEISVPRKVFEGITDVSVGVGCDHCDKSGYKSRIGIYEVLEIDDEMRELIMKRTDATTLRTKAIQKGMTTMIEDGLEKVKRGITTIDEVLRVFHE